MTIRTDPVPALGAVVEAHRGSLPYALIHGEALVACAAWALGDAGVSIVDLGTGWEDVVASGEPFVLHDALCPMTPATFIAACVSTAVEHDRVVVGVRPVTDTVKSLAGGGTVGATLDRADLRSVASPIVLPATVVASLAGVGFDDFAVLVDHLRRTHPVELVEAPPSARRVGSVDEVRMLEALTGP